MAKRLASRKMPILLKTSPDDEPYAKIFIDSDEFVVGRALSSSFVIPDVTLSRRHCVFRRIDDTWNVTDESTTGVLINGERVEKGSPVNLKVGDKIQLGYNSRWHFTFCFSEADNIEETDIRGMKKAKLTTDESVAFDMLSKLQIQTTQNEDPKETVNEVDETDADVTSKQIPEDKDGKLQTEEDKQNALGGLQKDDERLLKEQEELKQQLAQAHKLTENINKERAQVLSVLLERDQQLQNLKKNTIMEKTALKKKLKELQARLAEKEKWEEETKQRLEQEAKRVQMLEEEKKKQEEYNKSLVEQLLRDIEKREKAAKIRLQEALKDLQKDKIAIESEIKEKSEAKEDVGKLVEELETVKQNLIIVDHKREMLEKELNETKNEASICAIQAREEILRNFGTLMETELQCSICNELFLTAITLKCNHTFCKFCISEWKKKKKECPVCRRAISDEYRSISLDNFINKMTESLSDEIKQKRQELMIEREALERKNQRLKKDRKRRRPLTTHPSVPRQLWHLSTFLPTSAASTPSELTSATSTSVASTSATSTSAASTSAASTSAVSMTAASTSAASTSTAPTSAASTSGASTAAASTSAASTSAASMSATSTSAASVSAASTSAAATSVVSTAGASSLDAPTSAVLALNPPVSDMPASDVPASAVPALTTSTRSAETASSASSSSAPSPLPADIVIVDLSTSSVSDGDSPGSSDYSSDSSYAEGVPGSFYGGYGNCFNCGRSGHWANGCPDMY